MKCSHLHQEAQQTQEGDIIVYKLVSIINSERTSLSMAARGCSATYSCDQVTYPPLPRSPLFAYRTLDVAFQEYERIKEINKHDPRTSSIPIEIWMAKTTGEVTGPDRIPSCGAYYSSLLRHAGYGAGLAGCYAFFWQNVYYCLKHCIGKRAGQKLDPAITVCCKDLILLEQLHF